MADDRKTEMEAVLRKQRAAHHQMRPEPLALRKDRIQRAMKLLTDHADDLCKVMAADFGNRSPHQSMITDIAGTVNFGKYCLKHMDKWSRPEKRHVQFPLGLLGAKAEVRYEPKGVVGILSPWNFPVNLSFGPLMQIFAAGNRAMIKPSEFTEKTSLLTKELVEEYFTPDECAVFTGGPEVAAAFSELPFDHLIFTGSTATGRKVMESAAKNLVPVTLELGGKSPVFLGESADFAKAGERVALGKMLNAGQICLAPDYLYVPESKQDEAIHGVWQGTANMYPTLLDNEDYASVVTDRHFDRLQELVADARDKGAEVIEVNPGNEDFSNTNARKMPLTILKNVNDDMRAMQEEIFGPVLPVKTYRHIDEAIDYVNDHDRPLGLYFFGQDSDEREKVLSRTISGGVTVNDVIFHVSMEDLPFGGVGPSGMGSYHGVEGFREFSHARSIYTQPKIDVAKLGGFKPPYGPATEKAVKTMMK
ncbi:MAG TPA: coniferyl aldehyde dehydrogenase [Erythrobacter sp.]|jgi:coniferyl-aldehyde dehydrogenase|uniref:coniferyl aldehyde dehydrogenase n=1 Tax=Erythrobacteraceae TaxID=335929 RepID=UPI0009EE6E27|nr:MULTISPECIES: coniferyl aldehyde dehydrogenase [Erythrobacteraceae]MAG06301.1 coniferyl aldehyde dehydrogenase [Sphingomonadaceae bacterium]MBN90312.1 coniferyl aldehyde dehydrogenase [Erythrobacteraceae bacterium]MCZ4265525.1 coniferyl aldehyde dehydrogenase [Erythrobacter sp. G21629-S1]HAV80583.1 coniferyl aldehyde dehydrogenase [Erythrobacter sp.]MAL55447.1 coniferyl aldehyde dehydrogenase [Sphingomonadaceae bacterium]